MTFYSYFKAVSVLMVALVGISSAAKIGSGKVTYKVGEATYQKGGAGDWKDVRQSMPVKQSDRVRTLSETQVVIALPDGSSISIEENSIVELSELLSEDGKNKFAADIKAGKMKFDIQKQENAQSTIKFKTGTATAAIRGTTGYVGSVRGRQFLSVRSGLVEYQVGNKSVSVKGGQTAVTDGESTSVVDLSASGDGDFFKELDAVLGDSTISLDSLSKILADKDSQYKEALNAITDSLKCSFSPIPDTIHETSVTIKATCPSGIVAEINNQKIKSEGAEIQFNINWASSTVGEKKFPATCYLGRVSKECGLLKTYYIPQAADTAVVDTTPAAPVHVKLDLTTKAITVCDNGAATIEGVFDPNDPTASLVVNIGNVKSGNLVPVNLNGQFSYTISVSDQKGNWNEDKATVTYMSNTYGTEIATAKIEVDKSCKDVNMQAPSVKIANTDSIQCKATLNVTGANDDLVLLTPYISGAPLNQFKFTADGTTQINLKPGLKDYVFAVEDMAGNTSSISKTLGCYPTKEQYGINIAGKAVESLRIPPPPKDITSSIYRNLHFSVAGLLQNDPIFIKEITITQQGKPSTVLSGSDLHINSFDYQVELPRDAKSVRIDIKVKMKNGAILSAYKIYEVNKQ